MEHPIPICEACERLGPRMDGEIGLACAAFPDGIPDRIYEGGFDHRESFPGDNGILFQLAKRPTAQAALDHYEASSRPDAAVTAASVNVNPDGTPHTGGMVAFVPTDEDIERLALAGGEPAGQLHLTVLFLGDADELEALGEDGQAALVVAAEQAAQTIPAIDAQAWAADYFNPTGEDPAWVLGVGGQSITGAYEAAATMIRAAAAGVGWAVPEQHTPWVPHICIAYSDDLAVLEECIDRLGPVTFDRIRVAYGTEVADFPLSGTAMTAAAADEEGSMPFGIRSGGDDCPFEVFNKDTGEREACHQTRQEALDHQRALQKNVPDAAVADAELEPQPGEHFHAVAHVEGVSTGMRTFTNLGWREPPFAFHFQVDSSAHGGQPRTVQVGLVSRVLRNPTDESEIHMWGPLDLEDTQARDYGRKLVQGFTRWVSIGLDEQPAEVTYEWPEDGEEAADEDEDEFTMMDLFPEPEQVLIDGGTIGELTGVSVPAQADATIEPTPELVRALAGEAKPAAAAMEENECPDGQMWDEKLQDCVPVEAAAVEQPPVLRIRKADMGRFVVERATPPPAPVAGDILDDAETMADTVQALTAAAYRIEIPDLPPASWFDEPTDVGDIPGAFCVTDDGRIYGILAPLNVNHRAFARSGKRMTVPSRNVDYSRFLGAEALTASGRVHDVGPITMDCGHAGRFRDDPDVAPAHYDNACTVVGKIRVGETSQGLPWVAGALEPGVTPDQVSRMLACRLSGDWQPHSDRHGWMELVAALLVPSPGFPMARKGPTVTTREGVLVASSVPVRFVDSDDGSAIYAGDPREAILAAAASAGSDEFARAARRYNAWKRRMMAGSKG